MTRYRVLIDVAADDPTQARLRACNPDWLALHGSRVEIRQLGWWLRPPYLAWIIAAIGLWVVLALSATAAACFSWFR